MDSDVTTHRFDGILYIIYDMNFENIWLKTTLDEVKQLTTKNLKQLRMFLRANISHVSKIIDLECMSGILW